MIFIEKNNNLLPRTHLYVKVIGMKLGEGLSQPVLIPGRYIPTFCNAPYVSYLDPVQGPQWYRQPKRKAFPFVSLANTQRLAPIAT